MVRVGFLHPKHAKLLRWEGLIQGSSNAQGEDLSRVDGVDDAVVPETGGAVEGRAFVVVLG